MTPRQHTRGDGAELLHCWMDEDGYGMEGGGKEVLQQQPRRKNPPASNGGRSLAAAILSARETVSGNSRGITGTEYSI